MGSWCDRTGISQKSGYRGGNKDDSNMAMVIRRRSEWFVYFSQRREETEIPRAAVNDRAKSKGICKTQYLA